MDILKIQFLRCRNFRFCEYQRITFCFDIQAWVEPCKSRGKRRHQGNSC